MAKPAKPNYLRPSNLEAPWGRPFWAGLSEKKLLGQQCTACETKFFPPRPYCPECSSDDLAWVRLSDRGTLHSWTQIRVPGPEFDTPFFLGLLDLEGGLGRIAAKIVDAVPAALEIGMAMRITYVDLDGFTLYCLVPE